MEINFHKFGRFKHLDLCHCCKGFLIFCCFFESIDIGENCFFCIFKLFEYIRFPFTNQISCIFALWSIYCLSFNCVACIKFRNIPYLHKRNNFFTLNSSLKHGLLNNFSSKFTWNVIKTNFRINFGIKLFCWHFDK